MGVAELSKQVIDRYAARMIREAFEQYSVVAFQEMGTAGYRRPDDHVVAEARKIATDQAPDGRSDQVITPQVDLQ